ncbi:MAG: VOC family protein [Bacteroidetes bacterium]|nr:VOC family protein [Bacteroidota bacterium]
MASINPYLNFLGNTEDAFNFYKSVFGGEFAVLQRFSDTPEGPANLPAEDANKIMHVALPIGKGYVLMGTDALESAGHIVTVGNNINLSIAAESKEEADKIYNGLSAGGEIEMPLQDTFWGAYFGMFSDKFGVRWMVNYDYPKS